MRSQERVAPFGAQTIDNALDRLRLVRDSPAGVNHPVALLAHPRLVARCAEHESEPADRGALRAHPLPAYPGWRRLVLMLAAEPLWA